MLRAERIMRIRPRLANRSAAGRRGLMAVVLQVFVLHGCAASTNSESPSLDASTGAADVREPALDASEVPLVLDRTVSVTLDGLPVERAVVSQGGNPARWQTGADGTVAVRIDPFVSQDLWVMASHPDARIDGADARASSGVLAISLRRFSRTDNPAFNFLPPGVPEDEPPPDVCAHCHRTIDADWYASPHRGSASNPIVHDVYAGTAAALGTEKDCIAARGAWLRGIGPGTGAAAQRCYLGSGTLPDLNPACRLKPCDGLATSTGGCADCHAPGIDGKLGGRDLLEARGVSYDAGVHCDVCHKVESVDLAAPAGVAGRLRIVRPSEPSKAHGFGPFLPLTFGPLDDVMNPAMGSVARDVFRQSEFCAGCHQLDRGTLVPGDELDARRWPDGKLPIYSTYAEWRASVYAPTATCQRCHMPPDDAVLNSSDLQMWPFTEGIAGGWQRAPGTTHHHQWAGPRQPQLGLLAQAAGVTIEKQVKDGVLIAIVRVFNLAAGHALPTGEPMRHLVLRVEASCKNVPLDAAGGDAIPDFGGHYGRKRSGEDWSVWPAARVGQVVRVVRLPGGYRDYVGFGPFGDGRFDAKGKGMPIEVVAGQSTITAVSRDQVTLDSPLPVGDVAYLGDAAPLPTDGTPAAAVAGAPGFAFARVLVDAQGGRMAPHHRAVDVASDNRLGPLGIWASEHRFIASCSDPEVHATLVHRAWPFALSRERLWTLTDSVMAELRL